MAQPPTSSVSTSTSNRPASSPASQQDSGTLPLRNPRSRPKSNSLFQQATQSTSYSTSVDAPSSLSNAPGVHQPLANTPSAPTTTTATLLPLSHITHAHFRSITSADRSTAHSSRSPVTVRNAAWQSPVKAEDDDGPPLRPVPSQQLDLSSPALQATQAFAPSQYHAGYRYQETGDGPLSTSMAGRPMQALSSQASSTYQIQYSQQPPLQQPPSMQPINAMHGPVGAHNPPFQSFVHQHRHQYSSAQSCRCASCGNVGPPDLVIAPPMASPASASAGPWSAGPHTASVDGEALAEQPWYQRDAATGAQGDMMVSPAASWQGHPVSQHTHDTQMQNPYNSYPPPPSMPHYPQPVSDLAQAGPSYSSLINSQGARAQWLGPQFQYHVPSHMHPSLPASGHPASPTGPMSAVLWPSPNDSGPDSPSFQQLSVPASPTSTKSGRAVRMNKPFKHKSRKTWTENEWRKLLDLAEQSKRGDPNAEIDWDFVTAGFGGRRCRQGILTVAAKRGLKVSTRDSRAPKHSKTPDGGDT